MINKSSLWFLTLSSIIIVLSIYYIKIDNNDLGMVFSNIEDTSTVITSNESENLVALKVNKEEKDQSRINELNNIINDEKKSLMDKNEAISQLKYFHSERSLEEKIKNIINTKFKLSSFISIDNNTISIVIDNKKKDRTLANNIINEVNNLSNNSYYITVKFE